MRIITIRGLAGSGADEIGKLQTAEMDILASDEEHALRYVNSLATSWSYSTTNMA